MPYERRITYGPTERPEDIVYCKTFTVDGVSKSYLKLRDGTFWIRINDGEWIAANEPEVNARSQEDNMDFPELEDLGATGEAATDVVADLKALAEKVCIVGAGQAGCKIADFMYEKGYRRVMLINTTAQDMAGMQCPNQLIIGKVKHGAGKNPSVGAQAVSDSAEEITRAIYKAFGSDYERIIIATSGGGGTGCGATPELIKLCARYMEEQGKVAKVGVIVCGPKKSEGEAVMANHRGLMATLRSKVNDKQISPLIVVDNEKIGKMYPNTPISKFHSTANANIVGLYNVFNELAAQASPYSTLDPSDLKSILDSGVIVLGMTTIANSDDPTAMAAAIEKNTTGGLLSDAVTIQGATHAGAIIVASQARLDTMPQANLDRAFEALGRVLGGGSITIHQGVYAGPEKLESRVLLYTITGGCKFL